MECSVCVAGDVMLGRGVDQVLPSPCAPWLAESYVKDARVYVQLAEAVSGPIDAPLTFADLWGDVLPELSRRRPIARIINLETSITQRGDPWPYKEVHYRVSPQNAQSLKTAHIDVCSLANNHVLDWGYAGFEDTLRTLDELGIQRAGAGKTREEAQRPARVARPDGGRILVFAACLSSSGVPEPWAATEQRPGVYLLPDLLPDLSHHRVAELRRLVESERRPGDLVVLSLHWGPNWSYRISPEEQRFARELIDEAGVDLLHGHSSHHVKGIEVHHGRPILYGCGDLLTDYEGIGGHEPYRGDLGALYFATFDLPDGRLTRLELVAYRMHRLRLRYAGAQAAETLAAIVRRESQALGTRVTDLSERGFALAW